MSATDSPNALPSDADAAVIAAFWRVLASQGWHRLSMREVAAEAGITSAALRRRFTTPHAILVAHARAVDAAVLEGTVDDPHSTPRDRLFDAIMRRLDELQPHRDGVLRLLRDLPGAPLTAMFLAAETAASMAWMLEASGINASGVRGLARIKGLGLVWLDALRAWSRDENPDLSGTMAALDRTLDRADRAARILGLGEAPVQMPEETPPEPV
ncbi:TetR/AcrR family transcriptional regulator [Sabulicella glaciei]|uniref:TetR/AcrR family transcriptional regulator n=1 Tax=Sabulicella glaciei TaxID=2984948 RepID=A0ABT3NWX4_9PROT|nr:TetR/AcrR family transcriptional regulator [Roseococcus sp. MDT2-1-1]MCW8086665.1 TetR/AcrR family transcriptional regulator [Roseococcus sp. MDT2-1-1]